MNPKHRKLRYACYSCSLTMAVVCNLSPLLFLTFRELYGISYSLLGTLVLINFVTQLSVDLLLSFFSHKFNLPLTVKSIPLVCIAGLFLFAFSPLIFPGCIYLGLALGTVIFSAASGLVEVLISPVIAALPAKDPDREMSKLHSVYAWGVVGMVLFSTLFLLVFGNENWPWLAIVFSLIPAAGLLLFAKEEIPLLPDAKQSGGVGTFLKKGGLWLCVAAIFMGGSAECTMNQWSSGYLEQALGIPKLWGDVFGVALFGAALGLGRSLYAKFGKNLSRFLLLGVSGAAACYLIAALSPFPAVGLAACALTGFCSSMLWPGTLIVASDRYPEGGLFVFAMMASGGDLGASVGPQLVGVITDAALATPAVQELAGQLNLSPEQLSMKLGMLCAALFPLIGILLFYKIFRFRKGT